MKRGIDHSFFSSLGLDPPFQGFFRISAKDQTLGGRIVKEGDRVFANIGAANQNVSIPSSPCLTGARFSKHHRTLGQGLCSGHLARALAFPFIYHLR
jgi:hypothetical protein